MVFRLATVLGLVGPVPLASPAAAADDGFTVSIFHHNDAESEVLATGDFGGAARFVSLGWKLRAEARQAGRETLMVNAGDSFLAGPELTASPSWWLYDSF